MLLRLLEENCPLDTVVFYDTGMEFGAIYRIRDKIKPILDKQGIEFAELHPSEPFIYSMLERPIKYRKKEGLHYGYGWCGGPCRWATSYKTKAIREYKRSLNDGVIDYVGIAADEPHRFEKEKSDGKRLPLVEWNMTEEDCLTYCHERSWFWYEESPGRAGMYKIYDHHPAIIERHTWSVVQERLSTMASEQYSWEYWIAEGQDSVILPGFNVIRPYYRGGSI